MLAYLYWDPDRALFSFPIPFLDRPILWYGVLFALGFFLGYGVVVYLFKRYFLHYSSKGINQLVDKLTVYMIAGTLLGARLGDLVFYQGWKAWLHDPLALFKIWEGGLASHGAAVGILLSLYLFSRKMAAIEPLLSFWRTLDIVVVPTALACGFIRIGNFFNQEILGVPTQMPWGVIFGHPADGSAVVPRHPAQLYEALWLWIVFGALLFYSRRRAVFPEGKVAGGFLVLVFLFRFAVEFLKEEQSVHFAAGGFLTMGQYLSLPFIALGTYLICRKRSVAACVPDQKG